MQGKNTEHLPSWKGRRQEERSEGVAFSSSVLVYFPRDGETKHKSQRERESD